MAKDARRGRWLATAALLAVALTAAGAAARDDDWPQWGHDGRRTGASQDRTRTPMTELWSWTPLVGSSPLYGAAIWKGRIYYLDNTGLSTDPQIGRTWASRALVCANAKTGDVLWKRALISPKLKSPLSNGVAPVVSDSGVVYVYDQPVREHVIPEMTYDELFQQVSSLHVMDPVGATLLRNLLNVVALYYVEAELFDSQGGVDGLPNFKRTPTPNGFRYSTSFEIHQKNQQKPDRAAESLSKRFTLDTAVEPTLVVRTFSASTGQPGPFRPVLKARITRSTTVLTLLHPPAPNLQEPFIGRRVAGSFSEALGIPLLVNDAFIASTASDRVIRWRPSPDPRREENVAIQIRHPLQFERAEFPVALSGFPPLDGPQGVMVGTDAFARFFGVVDAGSIQRTWHVDGHSTLGIPSAGPGLVYIPLGGSGASRAIAALHAETGAPVWMYAPEGPPADPANAPRGDIEKLLRASHWSNPGLAVAGGCVYGEASGAVVALKDVSGELLWRFPLPPRTGVSAIAASVDHLFLCVSEMGAIRSPVWDTPLRTRSMLLALRRKDGKLVWGQRVDRPGNLAVAGGLVYFMNGGIHVFGPAERTYSLATDSERPEDYGQAPARAVQAEEADEGLGASLDAGAILQSAGPVGGNLDDAPSPDKPAGGPSPARTEPAGNPGPAAEKRVTEMSCLRLRADQPREQLLARIQARRKALPGVPLLLSLEALDETRARWTLADMHAPLTPEWAEAYVRLCAELAAAARPEHFEILPEINVYLSRSPKQFAAVQALAQAAAQAIHAASPRTRVALSFNAEVLGGRYSRGDYRPFGPLPQPVKTDLIMAAALARVGDEVGLTTAPQMAYTLAREFPWDYLPRLCKLFSEKPMLLTRVAVWMDPKLTVAELEQARFLRQVFRNCYWQDFAVVSYPELVSEKENPSPLALRVGEKERTALAVWREVLDWRQRARLSVSLTEAPDEDAEQKAH